MGYSHVCFVIFSILCIITISKAFPQSIQRILYNQRNDAYSSQQNEHIQGTVDEFLAIKTTTERIIQPYGPCIPEQYHQKRNKRSTYNKKKRLITVYPVNIYQQNIHNVVPAVNAVKPSYNHYGGYHCGNKRPTYSVQQPAHGNGFPTFSNIFNGIFGKNSNAVAAYPPVSPGARPVHEVNDHDHNPQEVCP